MLFNSVEFVVFLIIFFSIYWYLLADKLKAQNLFLVLSSYVFYGWWDWRFLTLILGSTILDFWVGQKIHSETDQGRKKRYLWLSILFNLGMLGFFKYFNFFADSLVDILNLFGLEAGYVTLKVLLPVGISFYTFQTLSYSVDVYREKIEPCRDFIQFMCFVCFFPQLVAGPIERAKKLLPQLGKKRTFDLADVKEGLRMILWGLFLKVVIGDNCANEIYQSYSEFQHVNSWLLLLNTTFIIFHIYCDFAGYSYIAIGLAKLLGIQLSENFSYPFYSRNIAELWRTWHKTLNNWFTDYVYIPLGGSRYGELKYYRNISITFMLCGFWHGAKWCLLFWGFLHAVHYILWSLFGGKVLKDQRTLAMHNWPKYIWVYFFYSFTSAIFYYPSLSDSMLLYKTMLFNFDKPITDFNLIVFLMVVGIFIVEGIQLKKSHPMKIEGLHVVIRWIIYLILTFSVFQFFGNETEFFYFQF